MGAVVQIDRRSHASLALDANGSGMSPEVWFASSSLSLEIEEPRAEISRFEIGTRIGARRQWSPLALVLVAGSAVVSYIVIARGTGASAATVTETRAAASAPIAPKPLVEHIESVPTAMPPGAAVPPAEPVREPAASRAVEPRQPARPSRARAKSAASVAANASATLMVSAKPPCEIVIDGAPTGLTTPQRSLSLRTGRHSVRLVNTEQHLSKTYTIAVTPEHPTKLIANLLDNK